MSIAEQAYKEVYPGKELNYNILLRYSGKFNPYNANVRLHGRKLTFHLSKSWKEISKEIQKGLIQSLIVKMFKEKKQTTNMDLYDIFMKKVHLAVPKTKTDPILEESFNRVNERFFYGLVERPNLVWGSDSVRKLGSYEYGSDTISISNIFTDCDINLLDYVMYHEILHKKHKFYSKNGRSYHHTREFREKEKEFPNNKELERSISVLARKARNSKTPRGSKGVLNPLAIFRNNSKNFWKW